MADSVGGTHIIKWDEGAMDVNDVLIYKHGAEDFKTGSVLIVNPSQVAIVYDTQTRKAHTFREGRWEKELHELNQNHIARLGLGDKILYGGENSYHIDVYFVNLVRLGAMKFGTADPIKNLYDPVEGVNFELSAAGSYEAQITDPVKFKELLSGSRDFFTRKDLKEFITDKIIEYVRTETSKLFQNPQSGFTVYQMNAQSTVLSTAIQKMLDPYFEEHGLSIKNFAFVNLEAGGEQFQQALKQNMEARRYAKLGTTYQQDKALDVMQTAAGNSSAGMAPFMGAGMGIGMGVGMGGAFGAGMAQTAQTAFTPMGQQAQQPQQAQPQQATSVCPECQAAVAQGAKFCNNCGHKMVETCLSCGAEVAPGAKFCNNCGQKLAKACPNCGVEVAPGAKFCNECGQKL